MLIGRQRGPSGENDAVATQHLAEAVRGRRDGEPELERLPYLHQTPASQSD